MAAFVHCKCRAVPCRAVPSHIWSIIQAAGAGRRLSGVTGGVPKQFFRPSAGESLLSMTLARTAPLARPDRTVVIVDESHRPLLDPGDVPRGTTVLFQPTGRGTATGVLMALMPVLAAAPDDVVVLTPSDHAVADGDAFRRGVRAAVRFAEEQGAITLFAVEPSEASPDFGWIIPGHRNGPMARVACSNWAATSWWCIQAIWSGIAMTCVGAWLMPSRASPRCICAVRL